MANNEKENVYHWYYEVLEQFYPFYRRIHRIFVFCFDFTMDFEMKNIFRYL